MASLQSPVSQSTWRRPTEAQENREPPRSEVTVLIVQPLCDTKNKELRNHKNFLRRALIFKKIFLIHLDGFM